MPHRLTYLLDTHPCASETFIQREIDALRQRGWDVAVASLRGDSALPSGPCLSSALAASMVRHALLLLPHLPRLLPSLLRRLPQATALARRVSASDSAGIHAHFAALPADIGLLVARHTRRPFTCSVHAWDVFAQPAAAIRRRLAPAAAVAACSQAAADAVRAAGVDPRRVHLVRHGLPLADYPFDAAPRTAGFILGVGRLEPKKGFDTLIEACLLLPERKIPFTCHIVGDGSQRRQLERLVRRYGLDTACQATGDRSQEPGSECSVFSVQCSDSSLPPASSHHPPQSASFAQSVAPLHSPTTYHPPFTTHHTVFLLGSLTPAAVREAMRAASVLVLPSRQLANGDRDGVANVLVEAMALGTPVITTAAGAAGELVIDGVNGRLVPPDDPAALAAALAALLADDATRRRLTLAARRTVEMQFDDATTITQLENVLLSALDLRDAGPFTG